MQDTVDNSRMLTENPRMKWVALVVAALVGCTKPNPASCLDNECSDPELPFCDEDGAIAGDPHTCIAVGCTPGEFGACRADDALVCNATGDNYDVVACANGCSAQAGGCNACNSSACDKHIIAKYLSDICTEPSTNDPLTFATSTIDTSNVLNCHSVVQQFIGPPLCVYRLSGMTLPVSATLRVTGSRAIAFVVDHDLKIDGTLDVSASSPAFGASTGAHGPGGGFTMSGAFGSFDGTGGGGPGFRTVGGSGGNRASGANNGGAAQTDQSLVAWLEGGPAVSTPASFRSGVSGGAVTLISCRGTVTVAGTIDANGGGGQGGSVENFAHFAAGAGGAGGSVAIQGMNVVITGQIFANGGAGGAGENPNELTGQHGEPGQRGQRSTTAAIGGVGLNGGGSGGAGGTGLLNPGSGANVTSTGQGGAGGGSAGFIHTYTPAGVEPTLTPSVVSPPLSVHRNVLTN